MEALMEALAKFSENVTFLGLWAILGPISVAAISRVWNRKNQKEDQQQAAQLENRNRQLLLAEQSRSNRLSLEREKVEFFERKIVECLSDMQNLSTQIIRLTAGVLDNQEVDFSMPNERQESLVATVNELRILLPLGDLLTAIENAQRVVCNGINPTLPRLELIEAYNSYGSNSDSALGLVVLHAKKHIDGAKDNIQSLL